MLRFHQIWLDPDGSLEVGGLVGGWGGGGGGGGGGCEWTDGAG